MNIIKQLMENDVYINIRYYGIEDLATGVSAMKLLSNKDTIISHYADCSMILDIDDYIDFVFLDYIMKFEEVLPYMEEEKAKEFQSFIEECKLIYNKYTVASIIKYIKLDYIKIYTLNNIERSTLAIDLKNYTSNYIALHFNSFDEQMIEYVINNSTYAVIDDFENWQKYFIKKPEKIDVLLNEDNINKVFYMRTEKLLDIILSLSNNKEKFETTVLNALEIIYSILQKNFFKPSNDEILWESYYIINDCLPFFRKMKSPIAYKLEEELKSQRVLLDESIMRNGHTQTLEFDLKPFKDFFEDNSKPWEIRIFYLTHSKDENGKITSFIEQGAQCNEKAFSDIFARNNPGTNEYFTNWRLRNIDLYLFEIKARFMTILNSIDNITEYMSDIYGELKYICEKNNTTMENENFDENMEMMSQYLTDLFVNYKSGSGVITTTVKNMLYGCAMFLCGVIEKVLRIIYKNSIKSILYILDSSITLGVLLTENGNNPSVIEEILGSTQIKCLRYSLHKIDHDNEVGKNIRNDLAHINGKNMKSLNYDLILELLSYFTCILNSCILYYQNKSEENDLQ